MADLIHARSIAFGLELGDFEFRSAPDGDGLTIAGYIARFNEPTAISDFLGDYTEEVAPTAFNRTLAERGPAKVKMQFDHGHSVFGSLPIGVWNSIRADKRGLWGEGRIHDTWHTIPIRAAIESGALDGMSFRFKVVSDQWRKAKDGSGQLDHRTLTEVALFEAGPVVHPAYDSTTVALRGKAYDLFRSSYVPEIAHRANDDAHGAIVDDEQVADPVVGIRADKASDGPSEGLTRREMRLQTLSRIGVLDDPHRGAA